MKNENRQKLIVIEGPTASGKTGLARELAREFGGFIISADSRQMYRYLDIGAGKADTEEELLEIQKQREALDRLERRDPYSTSYILHSIPHYMIDIIDPREEYNVALYQKDVYALLNVNCQLSIVNRLPILVGGTGQYIDAVVDNWQFPPGEPDYTLRSELEEQARQNGLDILWKELLARDPECEKFVQKDNPRRIARALEYVLTTGEKFSKARTKGERQFDVLKLGIELPREELYKKIDARVETRIALGMIDEVRALHTKRGLSFERLKQFGLEYRVIAEFLTGGFNSESEMIQRLKWNIHGFARRQMTWFRRDGEIRWIQSVDRAVALIRQFFD